MRFPLWQKLFKRLGAGWRNKPCGTVASPVPIHQCHRRSLQVETLEDRCLPSASSVIANQQLVTQLYTQLLQRSVDPAGLAYWSGLLNSGITVQQVVSDIEASAEFRTDLLNSVYERLLNRAVDSGSVAGWLQFLNNNSVEQLEASIAGSAEFYADAGSTSSGFLNLLYRDLLDRGVDATGQSFFSAELNASVSRYTVALQILGSPEYQQDVVESDFTTFLHRLADPGGLNYFATLLANGTSNQTVVADIIASTTPSLL
jgi:hypothetical protein